MGTIKDAIYLENISEVKREITDAEAKQLGFSF